MPTSNKLIKTIFIDTSLYEKANFISGNEIKQVLALSESGDIEILMPYITYREILSRFEKRLNEAINKTNSFQKSSGIYRNFESLSYFFELLSEEELIEKFKHTFDDILKKSNVKILDYPTIDIGYVFEKYFKKEYPFSDQKKEEFPDAFALQMLEIWCEENQKECVVFSDDKDMLHYNHKFFHVRRDLKSFINEALTEIELKKYENKRLARVQELYDLRSDYLKRTIAEIVEDEIQSDPAFFIDEEFDEDTLEINNVSIWLGGYRLVSITSGDIIIESLGEASFDVSIEAAQQDLIDDEVEGWEFDDVKSVSGSKKIYVQFILYIPASGNLKYMDIEVYEVKYSSR